MLDRFIEAQNSNYYGELSQYETAKKELEEGLKQSHWMWYIFPQIKGLGRSDMAAKYAIQNIGEATEYYNNSVLGTRLEELVRIVNGIEDKSADEIFGHIDAMKFLSCLTLFNQVAPENQLFIEAINKYYDGRRDEKTLKILREQQD